MFVLEQLSRPSRPGQVLKLWPFWEPVPHSPPSDIRPQVPTSTLSWRTGWAPAWHDHRYQQIINRSSTDQQDCSFFVQLVYSSLHSTCPKLCHILPCWPCWGCCPSPKCSSSSSVANSSASRREGSDPLDQRAAPTPCDSMWKNHVPLCILLKPMWCLFIFGLILVDLCRSFFVELIGREGLLAPTRIPRIGILVTQ